MHVLACLAESAVVDAEDRRWSGRYLRSWFECSSVRRSRLGRVEWVEGSQEA